MEGIVSCKNIWKSPKYLFKQARILPKSIWNNKVQERFLKSSMTQAFMRIEWTRHYKSSTKVRKKIKKTTVLFIQSFQQEQREWPKIFQSCKIDWKYTNWERQKTILGSLMIYPRKNKKVWVRIQVRLTFLCQQRTKFSKKKRKKGSEKCLIE
jgi:hypothetical protein